MKRILILFSLLCLFSGCGKKNEKLNKDKFADNVEKIIDIVLNNNYDKNAFNTNYKFYNLKDDYLIGYNYNNETSQHEYNLKHDLSDMDMKTIKIIENNIGEIYLSIKNEQYCAVKDFKEEFFNIYDVKDSQNCNIDVSDNEVVKSFIVPWKLTSDVEYESGSMAQESILLTAIVELLDMSYCSYKWYRNGVEIKNSNVVNYVVNSAQEDAFYSVEVTSHDGKIYKSEFVHVVINK